MPTEQFLNVASLYTMRHHFPENDRENFDEVAVNYSCDDGQTKFARRHGPA